MKKILWGILIFLIPIIVKASSINYDITNFLIDATIEENGDLSVQELIVLDGNFNGYVRELQYKNSKLEDYELGNINFANSAIYNAEGIKNVVLKTRNVTNEIISFDTFTKDFATLTKVVSEKIAKDGNYIYRKDNDLHSYKMYQSADDETIAFLISYTIDKAVVIHNDVAELYWTFIGNGFTDRINNLQIKIHTPKISDQEQLHFWFHGDLTGESSLLDNQTILAQMKSLDKKSVIDARIVFPKELITFKERLRTSQTEAFDAIWQIEEELIESANRKRELMRQVVNFAKGLTVFYYIALVILWIFIYIKYDKEYKSNFNSKYYREFTGEYNVEVIDYLMNKTITPNAMSASIMNLIYKKNIKAEEIADNSKKKKYLFTYLNNNGVTDTEQVLLDFLFEKVGKNNQFTTKDLEKYASSTRTCEKFSKYYSEWKNCVTKDAERERFYETNGIPVVLGILLLLVTILIFMVIIYYHVNFIPSYFLLPTGIVFLIYTICIRKRTQKGNEDYLRWKAFKNFLKDFGSFKLKELPEVVLWEKYLVYATIFGLAQTVSQSMNVKMSEYQNIEGIEMLNGWDPLDFYIYSAVNNSISHSISTSVNASAIANSRNSISGGGGGFSGGAGFGGGGGGGHGF
jgi:uncharacterized membrane protein